MRKSARTLSLCLSAILVSASALTVTSTAAASPAPKGSFYSTWDSLYPNSQAGDNVTGGTGTSCQLCHVSVGGGNNYNGYGKKMIDLMNAGSNLTNAILGAEGFDSDGDPFTTSSLDEINGHTQPGWTAGPNNTYYNENGVTATNQMPPSAILGNMDPCEAQATETVRLGTPPNPNAFLPGVTSRPLVGQTWDPVVDHTTFHTSAILDILIIDLGAPINFLTGWGTLLCNIPPSSQIFSNPAGIPFAVPVPLDCAFVGLSACSQVGSFAPGNIQLTNALDIVIGSY